MYRLNEVGGRTDATLEADENKFVSSEALEMIRKLVLEAEHKDILINVHVYFVKKWVIKIQTVLADYYYSLFIYGVI